MAEDTELTGEPEKQGTSGFRGAKKRFADGVNVAIAISDEGGSTHVKSKQRVVQRDGRTVVSEERTVTSTKSDEHDEQ